MLDVRDERLTTRVGAITLALLAVAIGFFVVVYPRIEWRGRVRAQVYFHEVGGLRAGAAFVVAGRSVGRVESIVPVARGTPGPLGGDAGVVVTVAIDREAARLLYVRPWPWSAPRDPQPPPADVFVSSRGIVAERYLELAPVPAGSPQLRDGDRLLGSDPATLDNVLQRSLHSMVSMRRFADEMRPDIAALIVQLGELREHVDRPRLAALIAELAAAGEQLEQLRTVSLGGDAGGAQARALVRDARDTIGGLHTTLAELGTRVAALRTGAGSAREVVTAQGRVVAGKLAATIDELRGALARTDAVLAEVEVVKDRLARGVGSLMKLVGDPEFTDDMKDLGKVLKRQPWKVVTTPAD